MSIVPMSLVLGLFEAQMLMLATAIIIGQNGIARRSLGALLIVLCGMLTPFAIGYAGFYDRWPWLSFAPFAVPLAMGPLLYAHLTALIFGRPIENSERGTVLKAQASRDGSFQFEDGIHGQMIVSDTPAFPFFRTSR